MSGNKRKYIKGNKCFKQKFIVKAKRKIQLI